MIRFRRPGPEDALQCFQIESTGYEGDEAATLAKIAKRISDYPEGFLIAEADSEIVGFINSGCAHTIEMSNQAFKDLIGHDPEAPNVVILSVVVDPKRQGQGISRLMMEEFHTRMESLGKSAIYLMCKAHHVPLYEKFGYRYLAPSASDHGGMAWHEMMKPLLTSP